jgi:hypothetical protein
MNQEYPYESVSERARESAGNNLKADIEQGSVALGHPMRLLIEAICHIWWTLGAFVDFRKQILQSGQV